MMPPFGPPFAASARGGLGPAAAQLLVIAKAPVPGRVKTRLCPPFSPRQAATLAAAALIDTLAAVRTTPAAARTLVVAGRYATPLGWRVVPQRGDSLGERLAHAFADTARPRVASLLIGMDTPQVTAGLLGEAGRALAADGVDAVLGPALDGGWWLLGLRDPRHARVLRDVPMSTPKTGELTLAALRAEGLRVELLETLHDVDTAADAHAVAVQCAPGSRFAAELARLVPTQAAS
jgi:uncharacterized protein